MIIGALRTVPFHVLQDEACHDSVEQRLTRKMVGWTTEYFRIECTIYSCDRTGDLASISFEIQDPCCLIWLGGRLESIASSVYDEVRT